ncbi:sensor histidine kinase [Ekhidna sp.]
MMLSKSDSILFIGTLGMIVLAFAIVLFIYLYQRKLIKKSLENQQIQDLLREQEMKATYALLEGQDKERKRIAAELHDSLGSILVTLNMYADTLQSKGTTENDLIRKISETAQLANEETRKISHSLDSGMLKHFGLEAAIKQLSEAVSDAKQIQFGLEIQIGKISSDIGLEIYRIIQELVNNSLKHSQCTTIRLELNSIEDNLNLIYEDNGIGFLKSQITPGMGLRNIENRVSKLNGDLTIDSSPDRGSTFIIEIQPL